MANGNTATLPLPGTLPPPGPPGQDPTKAQQLLQLLKSLGPMFSGGAQQSQQQPQGPQVTPATVPAISPPMAPATMQTRFDPMSTVGTLPTPTAVPESTRGGPSPLSAQLLSKMDPQGAAIFSGVQGVTSFLQSSFEKKEKEQHAEAENAAHALMSALESAKVSGDYRPAEHILENNEQLFNKVYKGWLQKAEEAKKPQKKAKAPDPDVQGFEQGLSTYMQSGGQAPKPPSTLQGKSGAKYFMPQASPQQAASQQVQSTQRQALKQDPNLGLQSQLSSGEQRQAELGQAGLAITPGVQAKLDQYAVEYAKLDNERKKSEDDLKKSQVAYEAEVSKAGYASKEAQLKLQDAQTVLQTNGVKLDIAKQRGQIELQRAKNAGQIPPGYRMRWQATTKAEELLNKVVSDPTNKERSFTPQERATLSQLLGSAGAANLAKDVAGAGPAGGVGQALGFSAKPQALLKALQEYKTALKEALKKTPSWLDEDTDTTVDMSDDEIVVSPEDLK